MREGKRHGSYHVLGNSMEAAVGSQSSVPCQQPESNTVEAPRKGDEGWSQTQVPTKDYRAETLLNRHVEIS